MNLEELYDDDGFTFIETLVAFSILFLSLGTAYQASSLNLKSQFSATKLQRMTEAAEEQLAYLSASEYLAEESLSGENGSLTWQVKIQKQAIQGKTAQSSTQLFNVTVMVQTSDENLTKTWHTTLKKKQR